MALSVIIRGIPDRMHPAAWAVDEAPWRSATLRADPRFRMVDIDGTLYADYVAVLTTAEARALNAAAMRAGLPHQQATASELQRLLDAHHPGLVLVHVYEWESGLGE